MALQSKMTVYAAVVGVFALMGGIIFFTSDNADLEQVEIKLTDVTLREISTENDEAKFDVTFLVKNPSDTTLAVSVIDYKLYASGELLGAGLYSTADIALPGRAVFYPGTEVPLKNIFILSKSEVSSETFEDATSGGIISFTAEGEITTQTSWSETEKEFKSGY